MRKRLLLGLICLTAVIFALLPSTKAEAAVIARGEKWTLEEGWILHVEEDGLRVSRDEQLSEWKDNIKEVIVEEGVTSIDHYAFDGCKSIERVTFPDSLQEIGASAFRECENLSGPLVIPKNVNSVDIEAFAKCVNLTEVKILGPVKRLAAREFKGCKSLETVTLPREMRSLGNSVFAECSSLKSVNINTGLESTFSNAFAKCTSLEEIVFPSTFKTIGYRTFNGCSSLKSVIIMNPSAKIDDDEKTLAGNTVIIHSLPSSKVQEYAETMGNPFHSLEEKVTEPSTTDSYGKKEYTCEICKTSYEEDTLPLVMEAPDVISVKNTGKALKITWTKRDGATGYKLYRKTGYEKYTLLATVTNTAYTDTTGTVGENYYYVVSAYNDLQSTGTGKYGYANFVTTPTITSITSDEDGMIIKWKKIKGVNGYVIYRNGKKIGEAWRGCVYADTDAKKNGTVYKYEVASYCYTSDIIKSSPKKACFLTRQKLTDVTNKKGRKLVVQYKKNTKATGYQIQYGTSSSFKSSLTDTKLRTSNKSTSTTLTDLKKGKTYYVRVRSYKKVDGVKYYGPWSEKKALKVTR